MSTKNPIPSAPHFTMHYKSTISERFSPPFHSPDCCTSKWEKACTNGKKAKQTRNRWQDFCFMFWGGKRKSRKMFSSSTILCFSFAIHPVMFESPAASLVPPESRSIFPPTPRSWEIPANFVFRAEFWLTLQLRNKLKQRRRKNKPS